MNNITIKTRFAKLVESKAYKVIINKLNYYFIY